VTERAKDIFLLALLGLSLAGCAAVIALDPVQEPPPQFRGDVTARIEFVAPERVSLRCMERGVPYLANACTGQGLMTMPNPCGFSDAYAKIACHEMAHINGWANDHARPFPPASTSPQAMALSR
jgi:hypothetical protein